MAPAFSAQVPALRRGALRVRWVTAALFSSGILAGNKPILVRDFVRSALYDPNHGYFSKRAGPVGVLDASIRFNQLEGGLLNLLRVAHFLSSYRIASSNGKFSVCSGIAGMGRYLCFVSSSCWHFNEQVSHLGRVPWYAYTIAASILRTANLSVPLKIYEIGGGSGTCAKCILDYMMLNAPPKVYNDMKYISVEISSSLAEKQLETVGEVQSHLSKFTVEHRDAINRPGWGRTDPHPCWVLMLEVCSAGTSQKIHSDAYNSNYLSMEYQVLDNLPHDLVYSPDQVSPWMEVWIEKVKGRFVTFVFSEPLLCTTTKLMDTLHQALPSMSLIASDFSYLPDVSIPGDRAPLVSSKKDGKTSDHRNYFDAQGDADIFFPTDFRLLEQIDHNCAGFSKEQKNPGAFKPVKKRRTIILDTAAFMEEFGMPLKTRTKDGYNPLLDDFKNTKFYLSVPTHNVPTHSRRN
ncbi:hypothetical protein ZEAMMB73_Zm00001d042393 [Zea mays]|uniref:Protein arginine methyltransferase NDUFAF7 n=1 Tax=Zea mays TaxID=4577 RepID=A0A1D6N3F2_MAIZE|nr:hypothetical protein ZEAMMB73_Zm00001d042393 [Zea mays]